ncbi:MAG: prolyl aminopeptidase [Simkaniaceae bacterium]|nr:prolyl aminopeptidase [Candidatus Sacchlamyda saccharinae]
MRIYRFLICFFLLCINGFSEELRSLYPKIEPYREGFLSVGEGHSLYWEESGNPDGQPILFLHGGPGMGTLPYQRSFFDPEHYRIILFDQRGCGKSTPFACLENNTTWDLVEDIEKLRKHLNVEKWTLFGGSWGSTLALTYSILHPDSVEGLILRGIFLCRPKEIRWYYQFGAHHLFPDLWENYCAPIPVEEHGDFVGAYYKRLLSTDPEVRKLAAKAWSGWEGSTSKLHFDPELFATFSADQAADSIARIECHYFVHNTFFATDNWILENVNTIRHIPCVIIQGRYDIPCPMESAWELHRTWPEAEFEIIPDAGHNPSEPGIMDALIRATDGFIPKPVQEG